MDLAPPRPDLRPVASNLFAGSLLVFLAFFGGSGGYSDLQEYLDDAQRLWLKGDVRVTEDPPTYTRFAPGLPLVSGPFVWAGRLLSLASGGAIRERGVIALAVPLLAAASLVLFFCWARARGARARIAVWSTMVLALGSPFLMFTHWYYAEMLVLASLLLFLWGGLQAQRTDRPLAWMAAGIGIALMPIAHTAWAPASIALWLGMLATAAGDPAAGGRRWKRALLLTAAPAVSAAAILWINTSRFGSPFTTGYHAQLASEVPTFLQASYVPGNLLAMAQWLVRTPWLAPALVLTALFAWRERRRTGLAIGLALAVQTGVWLCYRYLPLYTNRFLLPLMILATPGLPHLGEWIGQRYPRRGPVLSMGFFILCAASWLLQDDNFRPFYFSGVTGELRCCTWYMRPQPDPTLLGSTAGIVQIALLIGLVAGGSALLIRAWRAAGRIDDGLPMPATTPGHAPTSGARQTAVP
jgi:hypothetical protein